MSAVLRRGLTGIAGSGFGSGFGRGGMDLAGAFAAGAADFFGSGFFAGADFGLETGVSIRSEAKSSKVPRN